MKMNGICSDSGVKQAEAMKISLLTLFVWILALCAVVGVAGSYLLSMFTDKLGLKVQLLAALVVLPTMSASGAMTYLAAKKGPAWASFTFISSGMIRMIICCAISMALIFTQDIPKKELMIWVGVFYVAALAAEGIWLVRAIRKHAHAEALGPDHEIDEE